MDFQTGVDELYNKFVSLGVTPSGKTLKDMLDSVQATYKAGKSTVTKLADFDGITLSTSTHALTCSVLGVVDDYQSLTANNFFVSIDTIVYHDGGISEIWSYPSISYNASTATVSYLIRDWRGDATTNGYVATKGSLYVIY